MKKMICSFFVLLLGIVGDVNANPFPTLKSYVVNGVVIGDGLNNQEIQKRLGKPTRTEKIRNECAESTESYYYYPSLTLTDRGSGMRLDEIFFTNPRNQLRLSTMIIDAKTSVEAVKKLGVVYATSEKGITTYTLEDPNDPSAWIFDFKAGHLYRVNYFSNDC